MRRITGGTALRTVPLWRKACPKPTLSATQWRPVHSCLRPRGWLITRRS
jgi:hypothetical protein